MSMKDHLISALREQVQQWEALLSRLDEGFTSAPLLPSQWTVKDVVAHLKTWQTRSIARCEAALQDREPDFPEWLAGIDPDLGENVNQANAWIYETHRNLPWSEVYQAWLHGYQRFIDLAGQFSEQDLLDSSRYSWLQRVPLANVLLASYDHHQEHYEKLLAWLQGHGDSWNPV